MSVTSISHIRTWKDIKNHILSNAGELDYLEQYEDLDNFLGSGAYGKVWKIKGKDLTIKVTTNQDESRIAKEIAKINPEGFLKIYNYTDVNSNPPTQIRIQQMCYPLTVSTKEKNAIPMIQKLVNKNDYTDMNKLKNDLNQVGLFGSPNISFLEEMYEFFTRIKNDLSKMGEEDEFFYLDVWKDNIMRDKSGKMILIDF
jgi:hypothetical protein